jgi:hypothetical protein
MTNPLSADSDGDSLPDLTETQCFTNPLSADTDHDGIEDSLDPHSMPPNAELGEITVLYDNTAQGNTTDFIDGLSRFTGVTYGTLDAIPDYQDKPI